MPRDLAQVLRGFLMGGADVVPGVSGGTIALILGIYPRLVAALGKIDSTFVKHLTKREFKAAAQHADLRFLAFLLMGVGLAVVSLAALMNWLLLHQRTLTLAAFFGMILASTLLVARQVEKRGPKFFGGVLAGALFAFWLTGLDALQDPPDTSWFVVLCGAIAICAMILPGISGAFLLLILGQYEHVTGSVKAIPTGEATGEDFAVLGSFAIGAVVGLLSFVRVLKFLLAHFHVATLAVLTGFMLGSLRKIWPYQQDLTPDVEKLKLKMFENVAPDFGDTTNLLAIGLAIVAFTAIVLLERLGEGRASLVAHDTPEDGSPQG